MRESCRCCLVTNSNTFFNIFEEHKSGTTIADNIRFLAQVQIEPNDGLSHQICFNCYDELHRIYEFCLKVQEADQKLREEVEVAKGQIHDGDQIENIQLLESEYFATVDDNAMQVCVVEEILEQENDQENVLLVEEIHDTEEINIVEEIADPIKDQEDKSSNLKNNLLVGLALVAASQENVNITKERFDSEIYLPDDENDEDYLTVFDPKETICVKPQKWKCGDCKVILRGDVSYEGHMNIHRQCRPHICYQCKTSYRCRSALKRHIDLEHSPPNQNAQTIRQKTILCLTCQKSFYSEFTFGLHQAIIHCQGDKCPFECGYRNDKNLRKHLECTHEKEMIFSAESFCSNDLNIPTTYQCFKCSETFENSNLLQEHVQICETLDIERIQEESIFKNDNIIEIVKVDEADVLEQCNVCQKKLLRRNLNKHMELHKRKEEENKLVDETKSYMCCFCQNSFQNVQQLDEHFSADCRQSLLAKRTQYNENCANLKLFHTHGKMVPKAKCYICKECGNSFGGRAQLSAHKRLHRERPYKCEQCDKSYPRNVELQIHMRTHTGELPYECHLCDKRFAIKVRLTYHLQKHDGITHNCTYCSAVYDSRSKLKAHLFKHIGMPYKCKYCPGLGFERRLRFATHMKKVHHKILTDAELNQVFAENTGKIAHFKSPSS